jgi:hypothetical protein
VRSYSFGTAHRGSINLSERKDKKQRDGSFSVDLVRAQTEIEFGAGFTDDPDERGEVGFYIHCYQYHMTNEDTGRTFHCDLDIQLSREELREIHWFLGCLLQIEEKSNVP